MHPVQQLRICLPACHDPSVRTDRGGGRCRSCRCEDPSGQGRQGQGQVSVHHGCLPARLHGLRRLRRRLPDEGHHHGRSGEPARSAAGLQLHGRQGRAEGRASGPERQGQPVQAAHARVLRLLRRLRRDVLCTPHHPAVRRPHVYLQRHRLLLHLGRSWRNVPVLHR